MLLATLSNILLSVKRRTVSLASPFWHVARHLSVKTVAPIFCTAFTPTTTYIPTYFTTHILPTKYLPTVASVFTDPKMCTAPKQIWTIYLLRSRCIHVFLALYPFSCFRNKIFRIGKIKKLRDHCDLQTRICFDTPVSKVSQLQISRPKKI